MIERKVYAATLGTGAGAAVSAFLLWVLGVMFWGADASAAAAGDAIAAVPSPVAGMVAMVITAGGAFLSGYLAHHTERPDLQLSQQGSNG